MLVLTRRLNQSILIGDPQGDGPPVEVTVIEVRGGQVRLGIQAPGGVTVHRKEVYLQVQQENETSAAGSRKAVYQDVQQENRAAADSPFALALMFLGH